MIEGKRIRLRAFEGTDAAANHEFVNDPETLRGMMSGIPFPSSYADEQQWLSQQSSYTRGEYQFAVETVDGDELAGRCGIIRVDWKNRMAKLAIMIGKPYRGKGYALSPHPPPRPVGLSHWKRHRPRNRPEPGLPRLRCRR